MTMAVHVAVKFVINKRWPVSGIVALKDAGCPPVASKSPRISHPDFLGTRQIAAQRWENTF